MLPVRVTEKHGETGFSCLVIGEMFLAGRSDSDYLAASDFVDNERMLVMSLRPPEQRRAMEPKLEMSELGISSLRLGMLELANGVGHSVFHRRGHANFHSVVGHVVNLVESSIKSVMDGTRFVGPESKTFSLLMSKQLRVFRMRVSQINHGSERVGRGIDNPTPPMVKAGSTADDGLRELGQVQEPFARSTKSLPKKFKSSVLPLQLSLHRPEYRPVQPATIYKILNSKIIPRFADDSYDVRLEKEFLNNIRKLVDDMDLARSMFSTENQSDQSGQKLFEGGAKYKNFLNSEIAKTLRLKEKHEDSIQNNMHKSWATLGGAFASTNAFGGLFELFGIQNLVAPQVESAKLYLSLSALLSVLTKPAKYTDLMLSQNSSDRVRSPIDPTGQLITPFKYFCDHVLQRMMDNIRSTKYQGKHLIELLLSIPYQFEVDCTKLQQAYNDANWRSKQDYTFKKPTEDEIVSWTLHKGKLRKYMAQQLETDRGAIAKRERALK
ncbi:hypothetical protein GNI_018120 [Gregarina niphandrodes]|uniref:Uncharacterized protein n=1 Tax=Gregarina niphandrodes TaxID=110365 RepID=A0A023BC29_GRENI|nr:hypothetical protein GNI_018120 [Gregarina niphandrodes]EZG81818.1 hypothetical protein GNI_018120 [Gregarina niphandrodes]|eukprot:XP_011134185.1 hypothetical protein GNI_018120 [Gregarina niphandrodes]